MPVLLLCAQLHWIQRWLDHHHSLNEFQCVHWIIHIKFKQTMISDAVIQSYSMFIAQWKPFRIISFHKNFSKKNTNDWLCEKIPIIRIQWHMGSFAVVIVRCELLNQTIYLMNETRIFQVRITRNKIEVCIEIKITDTFKCATCILDCLPTFPTHSWISRCKIMGNFNHVPIKWTFLRLRREAHWM